MFSLIFNSIDSIFVVCALLAFLLPIYVLYLSFKRVSEDTWTKITKFRWIIYLLGVLVAYFEYLPVTPYLNVFNYHTLNRFMAFLPWFVLFCLIIFLLSFIAASHYRDASKPTYLVEGFAILLLLFSSFLLLRNGLSEMRNHSLIWLNDGKRIENFVSPFPGVAMYDCSDFTKYYDVIFVPARISIEADILIFRSEKGFDDGNHINPRKIYSHEWSLEPSGSMWSDDLLNCVYQERIR